jgi:uncharacterized protein (DUF58 family)
MKAIFKTSVSTKATSDQGQQPMLNEDEIAALRIQASQIQNAGDSSHKQQSREAGWLPTSALGSGMDYAESREYQQGDDPRYINWRLSARSNETFVKTYHMESRPSLCIVLDQRRTMIFGTRRRLKITQALRLATMLAFAAEQRNLALNILLINDEIQWLGTQHVDTFLAKVNKSPPIIAEIENSSAKGFQGVIGKLQQQLSVGSLIYLISDFMDLESSHQSLQMLHEHYFVEALHIIDQAEQKLPKSGGVSLQAMNQSINSVAKISLDSNSEELIAGVDTVFAEHLKSIKNTLLQAAFSYADIQTDEDTIHQHITLPLGH